MSCQRNPPASLPQLPHFDRFMGEKKMHEVVVLTDVVAKVCAALDVGALVDLGSGKGYLSQVG